mmetsp:Transcript_111254/g.278520  ORF Transcript_111254/g.278520 Transcript_111254/m.278520 type:complete len:262 (-) Transcript_111254:2730-3515(-)
MKALASVQVGSRMPLASAGAAKSEGDCKGGNPRTEHEAAAAGGGPGGKPGGGLIIGGTCAALVLLLLDSIGVTASSDPCPETSMATWPSLTIVFCWPEARCVVKLPGGCCSNKALIGSRGEARFLPVWPLEFSSLLECSDLHLSFWRNCAAGLLPWYLMARRRSSPELLARLLLRLLFLWLLLVSLFPLLLGLLLLLLAVRLLLLPLLPVRRCRLLLLLPRLRRALLLPRLRLLFLSRMLLLLRVGLLGSNLSTPDDSLLI